MSDNDLRDGPLTVRRLAKSPERNRLVQEDGLLRPTRIVSFGGGTGLPVVLRGLARRALPKEGEAGVDLTAVVAMADDGGSSGRLRRSRGMVPPGDVRNCLAALANGDNPLLELFQYRFGGKTGLAGHAVGNLLLVALTELKGDFLEAVKLTSRILEARGQVLPSTLIPVHLAVELEDQTRLLGEHHLSRPRGNIKRVSLYPARPPPVEEILEKIAEAELITFGPGSLYSSLLPNLLVDGVAEAVRSSHALKVMIGNLMTQPGETLGMNAEAHVRAVQEHVGHLVDVLLVNVAQPTEELRKRYAKKRSVPVEYDRRRVLDLGVVPVEADLLHWGRHIRHDSHKVARCLLKLARSGL